MKKVVFDRKIASYFYIDAVNDKVLVITMGPDSPFYFPAPVVESIENECDRLKKKLVDIYIDLLSSTGDSSNRFIKFTYRRGSNEININAAETVKRIDLPNDLKNDLIHFYKKHFNELTHHSALTCGELEKLSTNPL